MKPRAPFDTWPAQRPLVSSAHGVFGHAWWAEPAVLVFQSSVTHADVAGAIALQDLIDEVRDAARPAIDGAGGLVCIHDFRSLETHDSAARAKFVERMRRRPKGYLRAAVVVMDTQNRFLRLAIETANLVAATFASGRVEVVSSPAEAIARVGARPSPVGTRFPGT